MLKVLIVHGMRMHLYKEAELRAAWTAELVSMLARVRDTGQSAVAELSESDVDIVFWGDLFYRPVLDGAESAEAPWLDPLRHAVYEGLRKVVSAADLASSFDADGRPKLGAASFFDHLVHQTAVYMHNGPVYGKPALDPAGAYNALQARARLKLERQPRVVIGHSLGTVIAYELLCHAGRHGPHGVDTFITLGSPMATPALILEPLRARMVALGLLEKEAPFPAPGVRRWLNIATRQDVWCVPQPALAPVFGAQIALEDVLIDAPEHSVRAPQATHAFEAYLRNPRVAALLAAALTEAQSAATPAYRDAALGGLDGPLVAALTRLEGAAQGFDDAGVHEATDALSSQLWARDTTLAARAAPELLRRVRATRRFDALQQLSESLLACGADAPSAGHALAQSLIEQGKLELAGSVLARMLRKRPHDPELVGLNGRLLKQRFVAAVGSGADARAPAQAALLQSAFEAYAGLYARAPEFTWHGINAVALAHRAQREGIGIPRAFDAREAALALRARIHRALADGARDPWAYATLLEVAVALGDLSDAVCCAAAYTRSRGVDAFMCASTLRQLREIWCIDEGQGDGALVCSLLAAELVEGRAGLSVSAERVPQFAESALREQLDRARSAQRTPSPENTPDPSALQTVFDGALASLRRFMHGLANAESVVAIAHERGGILGSGFVISGAELDPRLGPGPVLVTNSHVLDDDPHAHTRAEPRRAFVTFECGPNRGQQFRVGPTVFRSPWGELDTLIARVTCALPERPLVVATRLPELSRAPHVYIIGHSGGGDLALSLMDNRLVGYDAQLLHYRAPTAPGGSGSPVFDADWDLIGVHHRGVDYRAPTPASAQRANEGIAMRAVIAAVRAQASI